MTVRQPAVAGRFYNHQPQALRDELSRYLEIDIITPDTVRAVMVPHAGYLYSGATAGAAFATVQTPSTVLLIGPNHTGHGQPLSLYDGDVWQTPLGEVSICKDLNDLLLQHCQGLCGGTAAHQHEHSLEVQVPFLQMINPEIQICAMIVSSQSLQMLQALGKGIAAAVQVFSDSGKGPVLLIASSDMNHFENDTVSRRKDDMALQSVLAMDVEGLAQSIRQHKISMCGWAPTAVVMTALGDGTRTKLAAYTNSGETNGDTDSVVGYASVLFF